MGLEISKSSYENQDFNYFYKKLEKETLLLRQWLLEGLLDDSGHSMGVELEAWISDKKFSPSPTNEWLLQNLSHHLVVPELSKFNIEINGSPNPLAPNMLQNIHNELKYLWMKCEKVAQKMDSHLFMIGTLPTLKKGQLTLKNMTPFERYKALNNQLAKSLKGKPFQIHITGKDILKTKEKDIMMASATTSFQVQWKVPVSKYNRIFNATQVLSSALVALTANSPFVFGNELWQESRVPLFEHAVTGAPSTNPLKKKRALFGSGYLENSPLEYFVENLTQFPVLLPVDLKSPMETLSHLCLHNGTIWRWIRPIVGMSDNGLPHLRIENRVPSAGPTLIDSMASMAFYIGAAENLSQDTVPAEMQIPFYLTEKNFYNAAKNGLKAHMNWKMGRQIPLGSLILEGLLERAEQGLKSLGFEEAEVQKYIRIIQGRVESGRTGSQWQLGFIRKYGRDFNKMAQVYLENQKSEEPVHTWKL